jgi:hypothetical protein
LKEVSRKLKELLRVHVQEQIVPPLRSAMGNVVSGLAIDASDDGEKVWVRYRSVYDDHGGYLREGVLLEFGGRNITEPSEQHRVTPYVATVASALEFPSPTIEVLSGARTFWEKATMMHVECNRGEFRTGAERLSRHWYDASRLADHDVGKRALMDRALLEDVVKHKKAFFNAAYADYDRCRSGGMKLVPAEEGCAALRSDYEKMKEAGMFFGNVPSFDDILARLRELESVINAGPPGAAILPADAAAR